jgi:cation diffusion facilitator CzcD-associated flavoprotein CzcO
MTAMDQNPEHLDVLIAGAGLSGIGAGHYLQAQCPWASWAIFEARDAIGGMVEGVPNLAVAVGYTNASWTLKCDDLTCGYVCRLLNHLRATGMRQAAPVNRTPSVSTWPLLDLTSGYIQRSAHRFPKQGSGFPWQIHQSYLRDYRSLKMSGVEDDAMVFSNPLREKAAATAG